MNRRISRRSDEPWQKGVRIKGDPFEQRGKWTWQFWRGASPSSLWFPQFSPSAFRQPSCTAVAAVRNRTSAQISPACNRQALIARRFSKGLRAGIFTDAADGAKNPAEIPAAAVAVICLLETALYNGA
ncbi:hypothetical protein [Rhizobium tumorigenes]|uniref:hypothetical protein n=1 Tax=Rhizobium tumorigenes TaxID=2041385 RepID=UPI00241C6997|nr:hypothetical protein [Rhizobium tumorigenes]WFS03052.1 hypothetical protein PR016_03965 [Rhizobium tumorigenes]